MRTTSRTVRAGAWSVGIALVVLASGCAAVRDDKGRPLTTLDPKGPGAAGIDSLLVKLLIAAGIIFVVVEGLVLFMAWKFRRRKTDVDGVDEPVQTHGNPRLEVAWTIAPAVLLAYLAVFSVQTIWDLEDKKADAITVEVIGQQWWWEFRYDTNEDGRPDIITANQMVVPAGRQVELRIQSNDVIHSFWIPGLNGKKDAVPGRINEWRLEADAPGMYEGTCTEFCGLSHAYMRMEVKALSQGDYDAWVEAQTTAPAEPKAGSLAADGFEVWKTQCAACHQINGYDKAGNETDVAPDPDYQADLISGNAPNLTHLMSRERFAGNLFDLYTTDAQGKKVPDEAKIGAWVRNPTVLKPADAYAKRGMPNRNLSQTQIDAVVAYLTTLK